MSSSFCEKHDPVMDMTTREVCCKVCGMVLDDETAELARALTRDDELALNATTHHIADGIFVINKGTQSGYTSGSNTGLFELGKKHKALQKINKVQDEKKSEEEEDQAMALDEQVMEELNHAATEMADGDQEEPERVSVIRDAYNTGRFIDGNGTWDENGKFKLDYHKDAWIRAISQYAYKEAVSRSGRHLNVVEMGRLGQEIMKVYSRMILARDLIPQLVVEVAFANANLYPSDPYFNHVNSERLNEAIENIKEAIRNRCKDKHRMPIATFAMRDEEPEEIELTT